MRSKKGELLRAQKHRCFYCERYLSYHKATIDHMIARSRGGDNRIDNLVVCCQKCNELKAANEPTEEQWNRKVAQMRLLPPALVGPELMMAIGF